MYAAKSEGHRTFRYFAPEYDAKIRQRRELEYDLRQALVRGEFEVRYQPLVDLAANIRHWLSARRLFANPAGLVTVAAARHMATTDRGRCRDHCARS